MTFINILFSFISLYLIPTGVGNTFFTITKKNGKLIEKLIYGTFIIFALIQFLAIPLIIIRTSFNTFYYLLYALLYTFIIFGFVFNSIYNKKSKKKKKKRKKKKKKKRKKININLLKIVYYVLLAVVVILIIFMMNLYQYNGKNDFEYISIVGDIVGNNKMFTISPVTGEELKWFTLYDSAKYVISPWPLYLACLCKFNYCKPIIFLNNIMPIYLISMLIIILWLFLLKTIGRKTSYKVMFIVLLLLLLFKSSPNYQNPAYLLFVTPYKGEAFLLYVGTIFLYLCIFNHYYHAGSNNLFILAICDFALCLMANGGLYLGMITILVYGIAHFIIKRNLNISLRVMMLSVPNILYLLLNLIIGRIG